VLQGNTLKKSAVRENIIPNKCNFKKNIVTKILKKSILEN
jgi:hypothetical protein